MGSAIGNISDMASKPMQELTPMQQGGKALMGGIGGGMNALNKRQQGQGGNMPGPMPMLPPAPQYDFSQIQKKSPFYGG